MKKIHYYYFVNDPKLKVYQNIEVLFGFVVVFIYFLFKINEYLSTKHYIEVLRLFFQEAKENVSECFPMIY
jgi:hypothetical protein